MSYLSNILLNQLGADDANETRVSPVCDCPSEQGLPRARRTEKEDTFWRFDTEIDESLGLRREGGRRREGGGRGREGGGGRGRKTEEKRKGRVTR